MHTRRHHSVSHPMQQGYSQSFEGWFDDLKKKLVTEKDKAVAQVKQTAVQTGQSLVTSATQKAGDLASAKIKEITANPLVQKYAGTAVDKGTASVLAEKLEPVVSTVRKNIKPIALVLGLGVAYLIFRKR